MYVCMYVCMYVYVCVCVSLIHNDTYTHTHINSSICVCLCLYGRASTAWRRKREWKQETKLTPHSRVTRLLISQTSQSNDIRHMNNKQRGRTDAPDAYQTTAISLGRTPPKSPKFASSVLPINKKSENVTFFSIANRLSAVSFSSS